MSNPRVLDLGHVKPVSGFRNIGKLVPRSGTKHGHQPVSGSDTKNDCQTQANNKKKRTIVHFSCQERDKKKHKQSIISDNPTMMIYLQVSHHVIEDTSTHLCRQRVVKFDR